MNWYKLNKESFNLLTNHESKIVVKSDFGELAIIAIDDINISDKGEYWCRFPEFDERGISYSCSNIIEYLILPN
jgi:hypothetical protein